MHIRIKMRVFLAFTTHTLKKHYKIQCIRRNCNTNYVDCYGASLSQYTNLATYLTSIHICFLIHRQVVRYYAIYKVKLSKSIHQFCWTSFYFRFTNVSSIYCLSLCGHWIELHVYITNYISDSSSIDKFKKLYVSVGI